MAVFMNCKTLTDKDAAKIISNPDSLKRQILRAWLQSNIKHCFRNEWSLNKALRRNRKTLESTQRAKIDSLFTSRNCLFSSQAEGREQTLYFRDSKQTGRLRQQHPKGPLAKIDKNPRTHRFLSEERFKYVKEKMREWHDNKGPLPRFYDFEKRAMEGKHHIEFSSENRKWHRSHGTVRMCKHALEDRISSALENVLGIRRGNFAS
jgi:hypothetical protein